LSFIYRFIHGIIQLSFIYSFRHVIIIYTLFIYTSTFAFFLHTHWVAFWRPWICTSRYWMLYSIDQVFVEIECFTRTWSFSLFDSGILTSPLFILFPDSPYIIISCHSISMFIYYHVWMLTCSISVILIYHNRFL